MTSYANGTGAVVSVPDDSVTIVFDATTVSGTAGCNGFSGTWTLTGDTLAITPLMSTKMACEPAELMAREAAVMADLEASTTVSAGPDGGIELHDATGALRLARVARRDGPPSPSGLARGLTADTGRPSIRGRCNRPAVSPRSNQRSRVRDRST